MHLVDQGRRHVEETYRRPFLDRALRQVLAAVLPRPGLLRLALMGAQLARPLARLLPGRFAAMLRLAGRTVHAPSQVDRPQVFPAEGPRRKRVALLSGCVQQVIEPAINEATVRLLARHGCEVVVAPGAGCCGALVHHLGREALDQVRANVDAWSEEAAQAGLDAIVINASGCGTMVKDYGFLLRENARYSAPAARVSALAKDVSELLRELGLRAPVIATGQRVAYHSACSLQHGQKLHDLGFDLLNAAGFQTRHVPDAHLCCGSAGTYNLLEPELAAALAARKAASIERLTPDVVAAGNIGCIVHIGRSLARPVVHTVELLDWATGGPTPPALALTAR